MALYQKFKPGLARLFLLTAVVVALTTGCDQAREKIAATIKPKTVEEVTITVNEKIDQRKFKLAQTEGEQFLNGNVDTSGYLAWAIAKACAQIGEHDLAIKYLGQALKANAITGPQAMSEPLLEPIRTDIRFVSMLVGIVPTEIQVANTKAPSPSADAEPKKVSTAIRIDAQGTEVKAGDIVIKLPN